uniref:U63-Liphistoxin-Lth1a_1 n=1 Tax=Liphistius thaleban TaxID=1905330 RepID=A0A4Q8K6R1_9ARAC
MENQQHVSTVILLQHLLVLNANDAPTLKRNMDHQSHVNNVNRDVHLIVKMTVEKRLMVNCYVGCAPYHIKEHLPKQNRIIILQDIHLYLFIKDLGIIALLLKIISTPSAIQEKQKIMNISVLIKNSGLN